jgi:hypothetical protein
LDNCWDIACSASLFDITTGFEIATSDFKNAAASCYPSKIVESYLSNSH